MIYQDILLLVLAFIGSLGLIFYKRYLSYTITKARKRAYERGVTQYLQAPDAVKEVSKSLVDAPWEWEDKSTQILYLFSRGSISVVYCHERNRQMTVNKGDKGMDYIPLPKGQAVLLLTNSNGTPYSLRMSQSSRVLLAHAIKSRANSTVLDEEVTPRMKAFSDYIEDRMDVAEAAAFLNDEYLRGIAGRVLGGK